MQRKSKLILILGCVALVSASLGACKTETPIEQNQNNGYKISVTYDANGGSFSNREGVTIVDMFNPSSYETDGEGEIHISLLEPTDTRRPASGGGISLSLSGYFLAGWYETREVKTIDGVPVDDENRALKENEDGSYSYAELKEGEKETSVRPAYVYSNRWDFETEKLTYSEELYSETNGVCAKTLYAGWVKYYEFQYYYKMDTDASTTQWKKMDETTAFNYVSLEKEYLSDRNTIWKPAWNDGAMNYSYAYKSGQEFKFPVLKGATFVNAYTDEACTQEMGEKLVHAGTLDKENAQANNRVQNVYVVYEAGEKYRIDTAEQFAKHANLNGEFEIRANLDFTNVTWPNMYESGSFAGKIHTKDNVTFTFSNVSATHDSSTLFGGLFGSLTKDAKISNVKFENAKFTIVSTQKKVNEAYFGLFAGFIEDGATLENVSIDGEILLGDVKRGTDCFFNLWANGNVAGLTKGEVSVFVFGTAWLEGEYKYTLNPDSVTCSASGDLTFETASVEERYREEEMIKINIVI